jgi:long-chain acyl-CoA synthetase
MTPIAALYDRAQTNLNDVAFIAGDDKWSYGRLAAQSDRLARGLAARGIRTGDRIALHMPNRPELAIALYACLHIAAIAVPLINRLKAAELKQLLQRLQPALYLGHADLYGQAWAVESSILPPESCFVAGSVDEDIRAQLWADLLWDVPAPVPIASDIHSPAVLLATSGTTGVPEFVIHTQSTLAAVADFCGNFGLDASQTAIVACPIGHGSGLFTFFGCIRFGVPMILVERFDPDVVLDAIRPYGSTWQIGLPFMFAAMLERQRMLKGTIPPGGSVLMDFYADHETFCILAGQVDHQVEHREMTRSVFNRGQRP